MNCPASSPFSGNHPASTFPVLAIVGYANCGKTTLICRLLHLARAQGLRLAAVKHSHKPVDPEPPGKDTWRFRQAGAQTVALSCPGLLQIIQTREDDPPLTAVLDHLPRQVDLVLVEGYKHSPLPKLVFVGDGVPPVGLGHILAYISDTPLDTPLPVFGRDDVEAVWSFIRAWLGR